MSAAAGPQHPGAPRSERAGVGREGQWEGGEGAGAREGRSRSRGRGPREAGTDPLPGSKSGHGKLCLGGESGVRGGRSKLVSGRGAQGLERAPAGGVCLSGFFVSPPGPSPPVRGAGKGVCRGLRRGLVLDPP